MKSLDDPIGVFIYRSDVAHILVTHTGMLTKPKLTLPFHMLLGGKLFSGIALLLALYIRNIARSKTAAV